MRSDAGMVEDEHHSKRLWSAKSEGPPEDQIGVMRNSSRKQTIVDRQH